MTAQVPVPPAAMKAPLSPPASSVSLPIVGGTPTGTLNITLTQTPSRSTPFLENPANVLPVVAFVGVIATIIFGWKKMKIELAASAEQSRIERDQSRDQANLDRQHDADQAHQERITDARREVYLELISEMTKAQFAISLLPTQDIEKLDIQALFGGLITATAKISLLGEMPTVKKSRELLSATNKILSRALVLVVPISDHKDTENELKAKIASHGTEIARVKQEMKPFLDKGTTASRPFAELQQELQWHLDKISKLETEKLGAVLLLNSARKVFDDAILEETTALSGTVDELILAIRTELGLATSISELHASSAAMQASARSAIAGLRSDLEQVYSAK